MHKSLTKTFQKVLRGIEKPEIHGSFPEQFALKRFAKKFEVPSAAAAAGRKQATFDRWVAYDNSLKEVMLPHGNWYKARLVIQQVMRHFRLGDLTFTGGSSSQSLNGLQSVARKLVTHDWECTPNCADLFVELALTDKAFVKAAKIKAKMSLGDAAYFRKCRELYRLRGDAQDVRKYWLYWCLIRREASRYSVVPKNNETDRSIDLQPFINMVVQRAIGVGLKEVVNRHFFCDLSVAADFHRLRIKDNDVATIDLRDASDSNTWSQVQFLYPQWFVRLLEQCTPPYVEGLDGQYYTTKKVSSMGNGFTFELMSLTLLALTREFDPLASVFGDDIIVKKEVAQEVIFALVSAGWVVNETKTFVNGPFRESCGANFHDEFGYIESYDFRWPEDVGECITFYNKVYLLRDIEYFGKLHRLLKRVIPLALRGPAPYGAQSGQPRHLLQLDTHFYFDGIKSNNEEFLAVAMAGICVDEWHVHKSYVYKAKRDFPAKRTLSMEKHMLQYFQYLSSGLCGEGVITGQGDWVEVAYVSYGGRTSRAKAFVSPRQPEAAKS